MIRKRFPNAPATGVDATTPRKKHIALPIVAVLTLFSVPGHAIDPRIAPQKLVVCAEKTSDPSLVLLRAKMIASQIFSHIGIRVEWHGMGRSCPAAPGQAVPLEIRVLTNTRPDYFPGALGLCHPFDRIHGEVFYDRVGSTIEPDMAPYLLAYTLVHEITHLVQGTDGHSHTGVMKAHWDGTDFQKMAQMNLPFTDLDLMLIRQGLEGRKAPLSNGGPTSSTGVAGP
jgi:hypothetical protein